MATSKASHSGSAKRNASVIAPYRPEAAPRKAKSVNSEIGDVIDQINETVKSLPQK